MEKLVALNIRASALLQVPGSDTAHIKLNTDTTKFIQDNLISSKNIGYIYVKKWNLWTDPSGAAGLTFEYVTPAHNTCRWEEQLEFLASSFTEGRNKRKNMEKERALR